MRVHRGVSESSNGSERPCAWIETSIRLEPEIHDLMLGLGSRYFRNEVIEDDHLEDHRPDNFPVSLTQGEIARIYREEIKLWGESAIWTWSERMSRDRHAHVDGWLTELVVNAFPEMKEYVK